MQAHQQSSDNFKIITFPQEMPSDILKKQNLTIGFDPKLFTRKTLYTFFGINNCKYKPLNKNLIDEIWKRKINRNKYKFYKLPKNIVGNDYESKINKIVSNLKKRKADFQFISASENNAWLLNIRGRDTKYTPIPHSFILVNKFKEIKFFCNPKKISPLFKKQLKKIHFDNINLLEKEL